MQNFRRRVAISVFLFLSFFIGLILMRDSEVSGTFTEICDLVEDKFYLDNQALHDWVQTCRTESRRLPFLVSKQKLFALIQDQMDRMSISHFLIYSPQDDEKLWRGRSIETGLHARWMEEHLIVYKVEPNSAAASAGLKIGDEVLSIGGHPPDSPDDVETKSGWYEILKAKVNQKLIIQVNATTLETDSTPALTRLSSDTGVVTLSSFRSEFFDETKWKAFIEQLSGFSRVIIDLRENSGGNFAAMLRAVSPFFCQPKVIGSLDQPRRDANHQEAFHDDLTDENQIELIERLGSIKLQTFSGYGCFRGEVIVLIGPHTASVAEIFAQAMKLRKKTLVMGQPTAGDVLLAVWYNLPHMGKGYSFSIPEAVYRDVHGKTLEGEGVFPDREIFDDIQVWRAGEDAWLSAAVRARF
jgi:C-terminal processing protease CtpA/Prc